MEKSPSSFIQHNFAHAKGFCLGKQMRRRKPITICILFCCPSIVTRKDKGDNYNLIDDRYPHDEGILSELQKIVLDKNWVTYRKLDCQHITEFD